MQGLPVTIRLLDPPLHEFLPQTEEEIAEVAAATGVDRKLGAAPRIARIQPDARLPRLRLAIAFPEIAEMQARAIFEGAVEVPKKTGKTVMPEIMIPLVGTKQEFDLVRSASTRWRRRWPRKPA